MDISSSIARIRPWRAVLAAAIAVGLVTAAPVAASTRTSDVGGNPDTLSYFEGVVSDWQSVKAARVTEYGLLYLFYNGGTAVNYRWGVTKPPGFKAAKAVINYWLDGGKIVGYYAIVTAHDVPKLRILMNSGQVYVSTTNCWDRSNANGSPFGMGERILVSDSNGNFEKIKRTGNANVVTYRYLWSTGSNATQTDTLSLDSPPTIHSKIVVKGKENFKISIINRPLRSRPAFPLKSGNAAKPPTPAPLCKRKQT